jgi:hypothetical protein
VIIDQSYPNTLGKPGTGVKISVSLSRDQSWTRLNSTMFQFCAYSKWILQVLIILPLQMAPGSSQSIVELDLASVSLCLGERPMLKPDIPPQGTWDWSGLKILGGTKGNINYPGIKFQGSP